MKFQEFRAISDFSFFFFCFVAFFIFWLAFKNIDGATFYSPAANKQEINIFTNKELRKEGFGKLTYEKADGSIAFVAINGIKSREEYANRLFRSIADMVNDNADYCKLFC